MIFLVALRIRCGRERLRRRAQRAARLPGRPQRSVTLRAAGLAHTYRSRPARFSGGRVTVILANRLLIPTKRKRCKGRGRGRKRGFS